MFPVDLLCPRLPFNTVQTIDTMTPYRQSRREQRCIDSGVNREFFVG
ncbi:MAG: hypothetical protein AAF670_11505 [Planctomycetota bacterium]